MMTLPFHFLAILGLYWTFARRFADAAITWQPIYQFPPGIGTIGMAVRENGQLVLTQAGDVTVFLVDPSAPDAAQNFSFSPEYELIELFDITRVSDTRFGILGGWHNLRISGIMTNISVYEVEISSHEPANVTKTKLFDITWIPVLWATWGSVTYIPRPDVKGEGNYFVTFGDGNGNSTIARYDTEAKTYYPNAFEEFEGDALMNQTVGCPGSGPFGVAAGPNNTLWFTNSNKALTAYIPLSANGTAAGRPTQVAVGTTNGVTDLTNSVADSMCSQLHFYKLAVDTLQRQWISLLPFNELALAAPSGRFEILKGPGGPPFIAPTGVAIAPGNSSNTMVYVSTEAYITTDGVLWGGYIYAINAPSL